jgi:class 3 adenylate cyclase
VTFKEVLAQVIEWLQHDQRVSYRALKRQFALDDAYLDDLKYELIEVQELATDREGNMLIWTGGTPATPAPVSPSVPSELLSAPQEVHQAQTAVPPPTPLTPDAERRQLTVLFCDLVDSTTLSRQLDPEDLREVVRAYQEVCAKVIARFEGHIAQYLGDGLLVYFGYPLAHEDDAQRAVRAGLGMIETVGQLNTRLAQARGVQLAVCLGIHTGLVVVGDIGSGTRQEQLALGETPIIAYRLQDLAAPNTLEFIPLSFWYDAPLISRYSDRRHDPWLVYGLPSCSPVR